MKVGRWKAVLSAVSLIKKTRDRGVILRNKELEYLNQLCESTDLRRETYKQVQPKSRREGITAKLKNLERGCLYGVPL